MEVHASKNRKRRLVTLGVLALAAGFAAKAYNDTMSAPQVMRASVTFDTLSASAEQVTIALVSDIHVAGPDMPPSRLSEIVEQINSLDPDYLMVAGDFISEKRAATRLYSAKEAIAPFNDLNTDIRKIAVPGNHDHWFNMPALKTELEAAGFTLLVNEAIQLQGLSVGGLDDAFTDRAQLDSTITQMADMTGAKIILSHSPDPFPEMPKNFGLMLAGHTHCGQIRYPWGGSPATMSKHGSRYACGRVDENGNTIVTTAGLGTSVLPFRLFSKPEIWLLTIQQSFKN